uniref:Uncharacterized protein n=1 Tax=Panagrolaimus superbus TaxID=310955 RepID=A0A914Y1S0_9BILA
MPSNEMAKLEERIQQLEAENGGLIAEINALKRKQMMLENMSPPPLPRTPIPKRPSALSLAIGNKSPFWNQPSEFSPPPLDRAPSLEDHKASEAAKIIDEIIADSFPDLNLDFSKTKKKPEIIDEIDGTFNQHDVIAVADDDEKGKSDLKLLISHVSSQNDDKITVADTVKFESKDNEAEKCSSLKSAMQKDDSDKHDQIKKEGDGDDDDYMIPRFKLANP